MENFEEKDLILIGAAVEAKFAESFKEYCKRNKFNQRQLFRNLAQMWLEQDRLIQEHIYYGRIQEALSQISEEARGRSAVHRAKAQTTNQKQKMARKSSKSA